jgi:hypothetical protein
MTPLEPWAVALIILASIIAGIFLIYRLLLLLAPSLYNSMIQHNSISVDDFVGGPLVDLNNLKKLLELETTF